MTATRPHGDAQPASAPEPSGSTPEAGEGARLARYAEAIRACYDLDTEVSVQEWDERVARAVMAVADQETAELRHNVSALMESLERVAAEREAFKDERNAARAEVERLEGNLSDLLCDLTGGRLSKTNYDVGTMAQAIEEYFAEDVAEAEAESARLASEQRELAAQVAGLRSVVAAVEAWAENPDRPGFVDVDRIRATLDAHSEFTTCCGLHKADGLCDCRGAALASAAPDTATPGEVPSECLTHAHIPWNNWCTPASSADDKAGECTSCGHEHSPNLGGICVGCPCEEGGWR